MQPDLATVPQDARQRVLSLLAIAWRDMPLCVAVASVLINLLSMVMPLAVMQVYDRIVPRQAIETLAGLAMAVAGILVVECLLRVARSHVVGWSATQLAWTVYREMLGRLLAAPPAATEGESASRLLDRAQALVAYAEWHGSPSRLVLVDVPFIAVFLGLMAIIGGWLVLVPLALFALLAVAALGRSETLRRASAERASEDMKVHDFLVETLTGLTTIKAAAMEPQFLRRFERLQDGLAQRSARIIQLGEEAQAFAGLLSNLTQMATVTIGAVFVIAGGLSIGTLAACVLLAGRAVQPLLRALAVWNELQSVMVGLDKATPLLALPAAPAGGRCAAPTGPLRVELSGVTLQRKNGGDPVLRDVSLVVPEGSFFAVMGREGAGKSTFVDMLSGRLAPKSGTLTIGTARMPAGREAIAGAIAVVPPTPTPIRGTILENLTMFRRGEHIAYAEEAAALIGLDADIVRLPLGYDTPVTEGLLSELPAGLVQRICIARAIARHPGLLILDEANVAIDMRADQALARGLERLHGHTTIIIITNRPSFARIADRAVVLDGGRFTPIADDTPRGAVA